MKNIFALVLLLCLPCGAAAPVEQGSTAPAFSLPASDGKTYSLEQFKNTSWVVLAWFPKAFTPGCTAECNAFRDSYDELNGFKVKLFAASTDSVEKNREFATEQGYNFPVLSDPKGEVARRYGVLNPLGYASRVTFVIDDRGTIRAVLTDVDTGKAGQQLAELLARLKVPKR